jgi:hypothetical protein
MFETVMEHCELGWHHQQPQQQWFAVAGLILHRLLQQPCTCTIKCRLVRKKQSCIGPLAI